MAARGDRGHRRPLGRQFRNGQARHQRPEIRIVEPCDVIAMNIKHGLIVGLATSD